MTAWLRQYVKDLKEGVAILPAFWRYFLRYCDAWLKALPVELGEPRRKMRWAVRTARGRRR